MASESIVLQQRLDEGRIIQKLNHNGETKFISIEFNTGYEGYGMVAGTFAKEITEEMFESSKEVWWEDIPPLEYPPDEMEEDDVSEEENYD